MPMMTTEQLADENIQLRKLARNLYLQLLNAYNPKEIESYTRELEVLGIIVTGKDGPCRY